MKVLFVYSGNKKSGISPIINSQAESLIDQNISLDYFPIKGRGIVGYIKNISALKKVLENGNYNIIHAHYSMSAFVAALAHTKPLVVSLMGSDVQGGYLSKLCIKIFHKFSWKYTIVKSTRMLNSLGRTNLSVIPNGVNTDVFNSMDKRACQEQLGWEYNKKHILFAANPLRPEKNYALAKQAFSILNKGNSELHSLIDISPEQMPLWMNSADVVLLVSMWEGSPNVIKEAMACNRPIVSTDVGDLRWLLGRTPGCYIVSFDPEDVAVKLKIALEYSEKKGQTKGRDKIIELGLGSETIAKRIISVYESVLEKNAK